MMAVIHECGCLTLLTPVVRLAAPLPPADSSLQLTAMSPLRLPLLLVVLGLAALLVEAVNPGGFPNGITQPIRGWRSWNVR